VYYDNGVELHWAYTPKYKGINISEWKFFRFIETNSKVKEINHKITQISVANWLIEAEKLG